MGLECGTVKRQLFWFLVVGGAAAATHLGVVMALVEATGMAPLLANVLGWAVAFGVSFGGHYRLTFSGSGAALGPAARRFGLISFSGFLLNQAAYAMALRLSSQNYALLLAAVLVGVAVLTYVFSRWWAFAGRRTAASKRPAAR
jgi:putative flippase GtrA